MKKLRWKIKSLLVFGTAVFLLASCGKKTMVRLPVVIRPPAVNDLTCRVRANLVELQWHVPSWKPKGENREISTFQILRSTIKKSEKKCTGCPKEFAPLALVDLKYPYPAHMKGNLILWRDIDVVIGDQYDYRIITIDNEGNESLISNTVVAHVSYPPQPPKIISAEPTAKGIRLTWKDPAKTITGYSDLRPRSYLIFRRKAGSGWKSVNPRPLHTETYLDMNVLPSETYEYIVLTQADEQGTPTLSDISNIVEATTRALPPPAPPDTVWALPVAEGVKVQWLQTAVTPKNIRYNVYRKVGNATATKLNEKPIRQTFFIDKNVVANKIYKYAVTSVRLGKKVSEGPYSKWVEIRFVPL